MWKAIAGLIGCLLVFASALAVVEAHYDTGIYLYGNISCLAQKDPMNVTFYRNATAANSVEHLQFHMNWTNTDGSTMYFWDHSGCRAVPDGTLGIQRASDVNNSSRYHTRVRQGTDSDATWGVYSAAGAHWDELVWCGHEGRDFDQTRDLIVANFLADHGAALWVNNNNTQKAQQCNGVWTGSADGRTAWLAIG